MDRRSQRDHIRAAQDWLGQADASLARQQDVQGDLKLMLARAELARLENPRAGKIAAWGGRLAALLLAACLAAALCFWQAQGPAENPVQELPTDRQTNPEQPPVTVVQELPARPDFTTKSGEPGTVAEQEPVSPVQPAPVPVPAVPSAPPQTVPETGAGPQAAPAEPPAPPHVPDVDKQQLMQSAGKILRQ